MARVLQVIPIYISILNGNECFMFSLLQKKVLTKGKTDNGLGKGSSTDFPSCPSVLSEVGNCLTPPTKRPRTDSASDSASGYDGGYSSYKVGEGMAQRYLTANET